MSGKFDELKERYAKFQHDNKKQTYDDCAKIIVGFKVVTHMLRSLPKAIKEKNQKSDIEDENSLYKKESVIDYIEDPDFNIKEEVERISGEIERKFDKISSVMKNIRRKTSPFYWIKQIIDKLIKGKDTKILTDGVNIKDGSVPEESSGRKELLDRIEANVPGINSADVPGINGSSRSTQSVLPPDRDGGSSLFL